MKPTPNAKSTLEFPVPGAPKLVCLAALAHRVLGILELFVRWKLVSGSFGASTKGLSSKGS